MSAEQQEKLGYLKPAPRIIPRGEHVISRDSISENALKVLYRLKNAGYEAHLVGGSVRDLLLGREPKDFDVATDAHPEQIRELFRNCRLIGRRFRLAHVHFGQEIVEVSTFRAPHHVSDDAGHTEDGGRIVRDNVYGTIDDDVWRRDFTANALYYNIRDFSVVDYVGGVADIQSGLIRLIGEPERRFREDPVRLLRAVRFAVKLGFRIHQDTERAIAVLAPLLDEIPAARLYEELLKLFLGGCALQTFEQLRGHGLFASLFPQTEAVLAREENGFPQTLLAHALGDTDRRLAENKAVTPGFLVSALLWSPMHAEAAEFMARGLAEHEAISMASDAVISRQVGRIAIPRRFTLVAREIWQLQSRLARRTGKRPQRLIQHPRFRAAYDFLLLRARSGEPVGELADWWTEFQRGAVIPEPVEPPPQRRRPRRRGRRGGIPNRR
ncbi:MAG: polynucleotide adenylyltransferase PcnB [Gammaproteobacteria bacterium]|nr:polynucleotide adenylyltransferase PcnB [Gammaproteobacteria bacterium]